MKKDKRVVIDEVWTQARVREFLQLLAPTGINADFFTLLRAYQSMRHEDFEKFVHFFCAEHRDLNALSQRGETILDVVSKHRRSARYAKVLQLAGARLVKHASN